jgi:hypothetical protein
MADNPWHFLALDPTSATERDVKAAYARLLKSHRPDQDPEGFKQLRSAYETALQMLDTATSTKCAPGIPSPQPAIEETPTARGGDGGEAEAVTILADAVQSLQTVVATRMRQKIREAWVQFDAVADCLSLDFHTRCDHLLSAFALHLPLLAELASDDRLIKHLSNGEPRLPSLALDQWGKDGDARRLSEFSVSLARARQLESSEFGAFARIQTAMGLAVWSPESASKLAQQAYPHLATESRTALMEALDSELLLGRVLSPLPKDFKTFWLGQIRRSAPLCTWRDTMSRQILAATIRQLGLHWPGFSVLKQSLPPENWSNLEQTAVSMLR